MDVMKRYTPRKAQGSYHHLVFLHVTASAHAVTASAHADPYSLNVTDVAVFALGWYVSRPSVWKHGLRSKVVLR
jgi:hypothetical protein